MIKLIGYDFQIEYQQGKDNVVAEALSRRGPITQLTTISLPIPQWLQPIQEANKHHPELQRLHHHVHQGEAMSPWEVKQHIL